MKESVDAAQTQTPVFVSPYGLTDRIRKAGSCFRSVWVRGMNRMFSCLLLQYYKGKDVIVEAFFEKKRFSFRRICNRLFTGGRPSPGRADSIPAFVVYSLLLRL